MSTRNAIAIELGRRRLRAVLASRGRGGRLKIRRVLLDDVPAEVDRDDPAAVGAWLGKQLKQARFPSGKATFAIGRDHVVLKRFTLPTLDRDELPDMARLTLQRELPFDTDDAVIDFVPIDHSDTHTTVLAAAVPNAVIDFTRTMAKAAGVGIERISLRALGCLALLRAMNGQQQQDVAAADFIIDITGEGVEFCLVARNAVQFSRAAEVPHPQDQLAIAEAVVTEARRTWMSYRVTEDALDVQSVVLLGDERVSDYAAKPLGEMLKLPAQLLREHPLVDATDQNASHVWPLLGLLLEAGGSATSIDFANPRRAPDLHARARMRRLLVATLLLVVGGLAFTAARRDLQALERKVNALRTEQQQLAPNNNRYQRDLAKLMHLERWMNVRANWLDHAAYLASIAPSPDRAVFDTWTGQLTFNGVVYDRQANRWAADYNMVISIDGEARDRETADAFRDALTKDPFYTASTAGADRTGGRRLPFGFTYRLRTAVGSPMKATDAAKETSKAPARDQNTSTSAAAAADQDAHDQSATNSSDAQQSHAVSAGTPSTGGPEEASR